MTAKSREGLTARRVRDGKQLVDGRRIELLTSALRTQPARKSKSRAGNCLNRIFREYYRVSQTSILTHGYAYCVTADGQKRGQN